jgi:hypothetical protein
LDPSAGESVEIDIEADTPQLEVKRQLHLKTGADVCLLQRLLGGKEKPAMALCSAGQRRLLESIAITSKYC